MNVLKWFLLVSLCVGATFVFAEAPASQPDEIIIDMKYHGGAFTVKDPLYGNMWGVNPLQNDGDPNEYASFFGEVQKVAPNAKGYKTYYNCGRQSYFFIDYNWAAKEIFAVYHDTNGNGKIDAGEKLSGVEGRYSSLSDYVTSDFEIRTDENRIVPFKMYLDIGFSSTKDMLDISWVPSGYFYGQGIADGCKFALYLLAGPRSHSYNKSDESSYVVVPDGKAVGDAQLEDLNSAIRIFGKLYSFEVLEYYQNGRGLKIKLKSDKSPMSEFKIDFKGSKPVKFKADYILLNDRNGKTLKLEAKDANRQIPAGEYAIGEALVHYGDKTDKEYHCFLHVPSFFKVEQGKPNVLILGKPEIRMELVCTGEDGSVQPIKSDTVMSNQTISTAIKIIGIGGEYYGTMRHDDADDGLDLNIEPMLTITDETGNIINSAEMPYYVYNDKAGHGEQSWTCNIPGKYTITVTQDTGPLMGVIEAKREITVLPAPAVSVIGGSSAPTSVFISSQSTASQSIQIVKAMMLLICGVMLLGGGFAVWWLRKKAAK